jgi:hypothetical protein
VRTRVRPGSRGTRPRSFYGPRWVLPRFGSCFRVADGADVSVRLHSRANLSRPFPRTAAALRSLFPEGRKGELYRAERRRLGRSRCERLGRNRGSTCWHRRRIDGPFTSSPGRLPCRGFPPVAGAPRSRQSRSRVGPRSGGRSSSPGSFFPLATGTFPFPPPERGSGVASRGRWSCVGVRKAALSPAGARSSAAPSFPVRRGARVTIHESRSARKGLFGRVW